MDTGDEEEEEEEEEEEGEEEEEEEEEELEEAEEEVGGQEDGEGGEEDRREKKEEQDEEEGIFRRRSDRKRKREDVARDAVGLEGTEEEEGEGSTKLQRSDRQRDIDEACNDEEGHVDAEEGGREREGRGVEKQSTVMLKGKREEEEEEEEERVGGKGIGIAELDALISQGNRQSDSAAREKNNTSQPSGTTTAAAATGNEEDAETATTSDGEREGEGVAAGDDSVGGLGSEAASSAAVGRVKPPFLLRHGLRDYQQQGLEWLVSLYERRLNGILADEMGLGKTIQTIALLAWLACERGTWGPHLIVVPTSVLLNWKLELLRWCPAFKVLAYHGSAKERKALRQGWSKPHAFHVCITTYRLVIADARMLKRKRWR